MREILFRGKRTDNGEWVVGNLFIPDLPNTPTQICIGTNVIRITYNIIPETVGEFTGLTDKNGKKIFEGDIINIEYPMTTVKCAVVEYIGSAFLGSTDCDAWDLDNYYALEIIGNIHDNPELLKGGEK